MNVNVNILWIDFSFTFTFTFHINSQHFHQMRKHVKICEFTTLHIYLKKGEKLWKIVKYTLCYVTICEIFVKFVFTNPWKCVKKWEQLWKIFSHIFTHFLLFGHSFLFTVNSREFTVKRKCVKLFSQFSVNFQRLCTVIWTLIHLQMTAATTKVSCSIVGKLPLKRCGRGGWQWVQMPTTSYPTSIYHINTHIWLIEPNSSNYNQQLQKRWAYICVG